MARLPVVGSDSDAWGTIMNDFLSQAHTAGGLLSVAYVPPQNPPVTGNNFFLDSSNQPWASRAGSTWVPARQAVKARIYRNAAWTPATGRVPFDTASSDPMALTSAGVFTCPIAGDYIVTTMICTTATATAQTSAIYIRKNGTNIAQGTGQTSSTASQNLFSTANDILTCAATDQIDVYWTGTAVGAAPVGPTNIYMTIQFLHP